jgi:hypothetical protein
MNQLPPMPLHYTSTIVEREYVAKQGTAQLAMRLEIGQPVQDVPVAGGTDWRCPIRITFGREEIEESAIGVDSMQALRIGLELARIRLEAVSRRRGFQLTHLDQAVNFEKNHWHASLS